MDMGPFEWLQCQSISSLLIIRHKFIKTILPLTELDDSHHEFCKSINLEPVISTG
jgi:hypothetical protein